MKRIICLLLITLPLLSCSRGALPADTSDNTQSVITEIEPAVNDEGYLTGNGRRVDAETVEKYPQLTNLPTLYLTFESKEGLDLVEHGVYTDASYTFIDGSHTSSYYELPLKIKGRGNYSLSLEQKPYTLKLGEKADLAVMGAAKKWVLVTVHSDKTMLRNYITQKCAKWLGLPGTCDNEFVDVVANGEYVGTYVLTEKIEISKNRIEADKDSSVLFEIEMVYRHSCDLCVVMYEDEYDPQRSIHLCFKSYHGKDTDELTAYERKMALREYNIFFENTERVMKSGRMEEFEQYIDVDSFVNWYLLNELTRNLDSTFVTSCYCFVDGDGKLFMGPCWDYDTCYGAQMPESDGEWVRQAPWYSWLFACHEPFAEVVRERWGELRHNGHNIEEWFYSTIDEAVLLTAQSEEMEHLLYPHSEFADYEYNRAMAYLKYWLGLRFEWMDNEFLPR